MKQPQKAIEEGTDGAGSADERLREAISSLVDGEVGDLELRRVLSRDNQKAVDQYWQRYNLVSDILSEKGAVGRFRHLDISQRVRESIDEQADAGQYGERWWLKPLAGVAVAATVAGVVVLGAQNVDQPLPGAANIQPASTVASSRVYPMEGASLQASAGDGVTRGVSFSSNPSVPGALVARDQLLDEAAQRQLDRYLLRHTDRAALNNGQGLISYARVASFEADR